MRTKQCSPGVFCVKNITIFIISIILFILVLGWFIYTNNTNNKNINNTTTTNTNNYHLLPISSISSNFFNSFIPNYPYTNNQLPLSNNVLENPYDPPLRDERYFPLTISGTMLTPSLSLLPSTSTTSTTSIIPINTQTNIGATPVDTPYRQIGFVTPLHKNSKNNILPLMGRPLYTNRNKWQYYTISNQHNNVKLPILFKGQQALNDNGVDQIYSGDTVYVEGYDDIFKTTIYENNTIRYLPFI